MSLYHLSGRQPFRVVVREIVNRFEDEEMARDPAPPQGQPKTDTFDMTAYLHEASLKTLFDNGKMSPHLQDGVKKHEEDEDLFDESFSASLSPGKSIGKEKTTSVAVFVGAAEADDDLFSDIDTQAFHSSAGRSGRNESKLPPEQVLQHSRRVLSPTNAASGARDDFPPGVPNGTIKANLQPGTTATMCESGFTTAGGRPASISAKALCAARKLLEDEDQGGEGEVEGDRDQPCTKLNKGATPNSLSNRVASKSVQDAPPAGNGAESCDATVKRCPRVAQTSPVKEKGASRFAQPGGEYTGFLTGNGQRSRVSSKALHRAKQLFADLTDENDENNKTILPPIEAPPAAQHLSEDCIGLNRTYIVGGVARLETEDASTLPAVVDTIPSRVASTELSAGQTVQAAEGPGESHNEIGKGALRPDVGLVTTDPRSGEDHKAVHTEANFEGFRTAAGKTVSVDKSKLEAFKRMFDELEPSQHPPVCRASNAIGGGSAGPSLASLDSKSSALTESGRKAPTAVAMGFTSARGTAVKISAKALEAAKQLFKDELSDGASDLGVADVQSSTSKTGLNCNSGVSPAGGKNEPLSDARPRAARKLLKDAIGEDDGGFVKSSTTCVASVPAETTNTVVQTRFEPNVETKLDTGEVNVSSVDNPKDASSKTPARRIAGLKRRSTPMCHTPLNRASSPITPLAVETKNLRSGRRQAQNTTPIRTAVAGQNVEQQRTRHSPKVYGRAPQQKRRTSSDLRIQHIIRKQESLNDRMRVKLQELTLCDRPLTSAGSSWFKDDGSGLTVSLNDVKQEFSTAVDTTRKKDVDLWFSNHFEQIVWKLSAYSGRIRELQSCLTRSNVLEQLKTRWKREVEGNHRSPLRMIVERDESSERTMVLLVKQIRPELVLSDGWYSVPCDVDTPLAARLARPADLTSTLRPGHKLCISGALLRGPRNGVDPLHLEGTRVSIRYNSTRRARWFARLGFCQETLRVPLFSAVADGGPLPLVRVRVTSCSSLLYFEKFAQGGSIIRKESDEIKEQSRFESEMSNILDRVREEVLKEFESESSAKRKLRPRCKISISKYSSGEEIFDVLENSHEPSQVVSSLTNSQRRRLEQYNCTARSTLCARVEDAVRRRMEELRQKEECPQERKVAPLLKLMVRCLSSDIEVPLTVWRPSEELRASLVRPDVVVAILRANVTSCRNFPFGLTTTQSTRFHCLSGDAPLPRPKEDKTAVKAAPVTQRRSNIPRESPRLSKRPRLNP